MAIMSEPVSFLIIAIAVALAAVPLILKVVPPNNLYGLRTKRTLANRELWFQGNHFAGWALNRPGFPGGSWFESGRHG